MERNILIIYYSYSGKTRRIAEMLHRQIGGRLSQIYPRQPYPADFERLLSQVREENSTGNCPPCFQLPKALINMMLSLQARQTGAERSRHLWRHG